MPSGSLLRIDTNCFSPSRSKRSCARPLRTCADGPSSRASRARSAGADDPGAAAASTLSTRPRRSNSDWPVGRSNSAIVAVPSAFTSPKRTMPDTRKDRAGPPTAMRTLSPIPRPSRSAVAASIATAPAPAGQAPSSSRKADRRRAAASVNGKPTPKYGPDPETFPAVPVIFTSSRRTSPAAAATPEVVATRPTAESGSEGREAPWMSLVRSTGDRASTAASTSS